MDEPRTDSDWLAEIRARDLDAALGLLLDVLAPLGPLAAQLLYVAQPFAGMVGGSLWRDAAAGIAEALEAPGGTDALRARLDAHDE